MSAMDEFIDRVTAITARMPAHAIVEEDQALATLRDILAVDGLDLADPIIARTALATIYIPAVWADFSPVIGPDVQALAVVLARYAKAVGS